jgi:hypothetical protein
MRVSLVAVAWAACRHPGDAPEDTPPATSPAPEIPASCTPSDESGDGWLFALDETATHAVLPRFTVAVDAEAHQLLLDYGDALALHAASPEDTDKPATAWVEATVTVTKPDGTEVHLDRVGLTLKGKLGSSFQPVDSKPYLALRFDLFVPGQALEGHHQLRLYNQWQDVGQVARYLGYDLWNRRGYPAPRAGFSELTWEVDGASVDLGLYGTNETIDCDFLTRPQVAPFVGTVSHLYEGEYGTDLKSDTAEDLAGERAVGDGPPTALYALVDALEAGVVGSEVMDEAHVDRFLKYWALEIAVGAREGYIAQINNFMLVFDDQGQPTFLPWGFDQVLYDELPIDLTDAALASDPSIRDRFHAVLANELTAIDWAPSAGRIDGVLGALDLPPEGDRLLFPVGRPQAYHPTEIVSAQNNIRSYLDRAHVHLLSDLDALGR